MEAAAAQNVVAANRWRLAARYLPHALILAAVLSGFGYVYAYGVNVFWADDWNVRSNLMEHYANGTLTAAEFWTAHNEHRIPVPQLVMLALGVLTNGNVVADMYASEFLLLGMLGIYYAVCRSQFTRDRAIWLMVPIALLVFSLRQHDNMLWGFQVSFVLVAASAVAAFFCLSRIRDDRVAPGLVGAVLAATIGAGSSIHGLLIWPVGLGQLIISPLTARRKICLATLWALVGAGQWFVYFQNWSHPGHHPPLAFSWHYYILSIGGALSSDTDWALVAGALLAVLTAAAVGFVIVKRQWKAHAFWLATMAFSLAALGAITVGRCGFGPGQAMMSRYATYAIPLVIALCAIFAAQSNERPNRMGDHFLRFTLGLSMVAVGICFVRGWIIGNELRLAREQQRTVIAAIDAQPDEAITCHPDAKHVRVWTDTLKRLNCSIFADPELRSGRHAPDAPSPVAAVPQEYRSNTR
jgi:hypothetical protein